MVLESIVTDVLNRFLGDYVENLNRNQLKIGIWGGDVVLENLVLKQNALDELDLPVQTIFGHLGKLVLKIPWKNLYGASVEASIERLFLLVAPNKEVKYDPQKEDRLALESKKSELQRVEDAKKREALKDQPKVDETFVEKLVTQIIKNVQLNIKDIHVRYEDKVTNPGAPFSLGVSLANLSVCTTDERWVACVLDQAVTKIYKILELEGLAMYWNPSSAMYSGLSREQLLDKFQSEIATKASKPNYKYILGPINASAKLKLNPKPELDNPVFIIPKCVLTLDMDQLAIGISKAQYQDIMKLLDSMDRMEKGQPYRKFRPFLNVYKGHYKEWWHFAYKCILDGEVQRKRNNWDWNHIFKHRETCREYAKAYQTKLETPSNKVPTVLVSFLDECEKSLDLFNLVVIRQRIEMEVEKLKKVKEEANKGRSFFSSWWGGSSAKDDELAEATDIMKKFEKAMTPEEKSKLFQAIDYQENSAPTHLPINFIATECHFTLGCLTLNVSNDKFDVLTSRLNHVQASLEQRPSANALRVIVRMQEFTVSGVERNGTIPHLVTTEEIRRGISLLDVTFETNPLDESCGQRVKVSARPLKMVYDAETIIKIVDVFKPPSESSALAQLQLAANNKISEMKEKSALGLQYAVNKHTALDIDIDISSSYLIMPHGGFYTGKESCLVVNFGAVSVKSAPKTTGDSLDIHKMFREGADNEEIFKQACKHAYDKFLLQLMDIQVVIASKGEDWKSVITGSTVTPAHLLKPTTLKVEIDKCRVIDDPRLPKVRVYGHLPQIGINVFEDRLLVMLEIIFSIPFPEGEPTPSMTAAESVASIMKYFDPAENQRRQAEKRKEILEDEYVQMTEVEAEFIMGEFVLCVLRPQEAESDSISDESRRLITFEVIGLQLTASQRTLSMDASARLGGVSMALHRPDNSDLHMIETIRGDEDTRQYLFSVRYTNVNKICPDFHSRYGSVEQLIELDFTTLQLLLHQEGIQEIMQFAGQFQTRMNAVQGNKDRAGSAGTPLSTIPEDQEVALTKPSRTSSAVSKQRKSGKVETIGVKVAVNMEKVGVEIATSKRSLALMAVTGLKAGLIVKNSYTQLDMTLQDITVIDTNSATLHKKILSIVGGEAFRVQLVMFNLEHFTNVGANDMNVDAQISCIRVVFLNWFVSSMLQFLDNFQTATQAIKDASAIAAESAKANVQNAYEMATKVGMNVSLNAPIVIVPENSKSRNATMVDFGFITITNKFTELDVKEQHVVVTDDMTMTLSDFKLCQVKLDELDISEVTSEKILLQPTSFQLIVKRNLSASWYSKIPSMDLYGRLHAIKIRLTNDDIKMLMKVLSENLTEGTETAPPPKPVERPQLKTSLSTESRPSAMKKSETAMYAAKRKESIKEMGVVTTIQFKFTMDSLTVDLMYKMVENTKLLSPQNTSIDALEESGLGRFSLLLLSIKGKMLSDNSMYTSLLLVDCILDDMRPSRENKISRMMMRKVADTDVQDEIGKASEKLRSMIDVTFSQKQGDTFMDVRIYSFNMILSMDFLKKISDFLTSALVPPTPENQLQESVEKRQSKVESKAAKKSEKLEKKQLVQVQETPKQTGMVTIKLKVEKPDIILVECMEGNKDCQAMVLNNEISFNMRITEDRKVMDGVIEQFHLYTCLYGSKGVRGKGHYSVLEPFDISLQGSAIGEGGWKLAIDCTKLRVNVSPGTIELLNRVLETVTHSDDNAGVEEDKVQLHKDLWDIKTFQESNYWFLKTEMAEEAFEMQSPDQAQTSGGSTASGELCIISAPDIVFCIEAGVSSETIPMLIMSAALQAQVKDWSDQLNMESTWQMVMSYYNENQALWEPLIEPVEVLKDNGKLEHVPWELRMQVQMNKDAPGSKSNSVVQSPEVEQQGALDTTDGGEVVLPQPNMVVQISSSETLEVTVTSTALQVLNHLATSYSTAVRGGKNVDKALLPVCPYLVKNETGITVTLDLVDDVFTLFSQADSTMELTNPPSGDVITLEHGEVVPLELKPGILRTTKLNEKLPGWTVHVKIPEFDAEACLPAVKADKRYFPLHGSLKPEQISSTGLLTLDGVGFMSQVSVVEGSIIVALRSIMQVINKLSVPVEVHFMTNSENYVESLGVVEPNATMNLPLKAVHTRTNEIFFSIEGYNVCAKPFVWKNLQMTIKESKLLSCAAKKKERERFFFKAYGEMEQIFLADTNRRTMNSACFNITLCPAVVLQNTLPIDIIVSAMGVENPEEKRVKPGETLHLPQVDPGQTQVVIMLPSYLEKCWACTREMPEIAPEFSVWTFESHDSTLTMSLDLGMHCSVVDGSQHFSLYCPFWMLNKTGLTLAYRSSEELTNVLYHPPEYKEPVLFSFKAKNFFGKKKASIRIENGEWSDKFSLDIPGSSGVVVCKCGEVTYQIGVSNHLTYNSLTKQVTFTPYFLLINKAPFAIECQELDRPGDPFKKVEAKSSIPLWPRSLKEDKLLRIKVADNPTLSSPFIYTDQHTSLLKLNNEYGAINVETLVTEGGIYVTLDQYRLGFAPALIINHTIFDVKLWEKDSINIKTLHTMQSLMYSWENPAGPRMLVFEGFKKKEVANDLRKDGLGEFMVGNETRAFWVSFLDGMQRVLLFTSDILIAHSAHSAGEAGSINMEATVSLHGIGLSLVNNISRHEIMYIGITSSGIIWEQSKNKYKRFKPLNMNDTALLEAAYQRYTAALEVGDASASRVQVDNNMEVDFFNMEMLKPKKRKLRRILQPGLWAQYGAGTHRTQIHARLHRLQIDQQLPNPIFPVMLAPVPPPKSVAASQAMKPFVELCIVQRVMEHTNIKQYKYYKLLVQEFHVKVDMGLVNAMLGMFPQEEISESDALEKFTKDVEYAGRPLESVVAEFTATDQKNFYDLMHLSPLKVHLSFSLGSDQQLPSFMGTVLQGLGVTLTDLNDVLFKLGYYERTYEFLSQKELVATATSHYAGQGLKQLYVLVLGLDVLGNPYGLVVGLTKGVEDLFYEPFQGAIQGPGEFAEGLLLGVRSLFGHTVGGAAGAVSKITGAMGKGIAALSMDEDYQRKRRENLNKPAASLQQGIARSGKGLLMGVYEGVSGVVTKPISGAKEEGAIGFFKGLGKGAVGLVARPTAGIVDFASGSLDAVKRAAEMSQEASRMRNSRWLEPDGLVRPYSKHSAEGYKLLRDLDKGKYVTTDLYVSHFWVVAAKEVVLCTDKRIAYLERNTVFGGWQIVWSYTWIELPSPPSVKDNGVFIPVPNDGKKRSLFSSSTSGKVILMHDPEKKTQLVEMCLKLIKDSR